VGRMQEEVVVDKIRCSFFGHIWIVPE